MERKERKTKEKREENGKQKQAGVVPKIHLFPSLHEATRDTTPLVDPGLITMIIVLSSS